jgi:mono/diheme cytochrome c family protein
MKTPGILLCCLGVMPVLVTSAIAQQHDKSEKASNPAGALPAATHDSMASQESASVSSTQDAERIARVEGEKRFHTNCGRCHQPPHKFPPRVMATAIRHMRIRAMITDEDMRLILKYMTQ